jgi:hypothetical protein
LLFGLLAFVYLSAFPYHPKLRSPNELCRLWQTRALVEYGTLDINRALVDYGYVGDLSVKNERYYPSKAPLLSFAAVPVYAALRALGGGYRYAVAELPLVYFSRLFLTVLPTLLMLVWLRRFLRAHVDAPVADGLTATYALGSLGLSYSLLFMSHQAAAVLLFASFYSLWRTLRGDWRPRGHLLAGAFAGAAVAAEYTSAIGVAGLVLYTLAAILSGTDLIRRDKGRRAITALGLAAAGAAPFAIGLMLYHWACFGHPLQTGYRYLNDVAYQPWHTGGLLGIGLPDARAFLLSFFSPLRGLFVLAPFLLLAFPGLAILFARTKGRPAERAIFWLAAALLAMYGYFTSSFSYESWGWTTGPRHLTGLVPFLVLPAALTVQWLRERATSGSRPALGVAAGLCTLSVLVTGTVSLVNYIPDSASNALFGLAIPLFRRGFWPPTLWNLLGIPNPGAGMAVVAAVGCAAFLIGFALIRVPSPGHSPSASRTAAALAGASVCVVYLAGLALAADSARDAGALEHLESVWLVQDGKREQ